jgi:TolB-like protein/tetratricopeptide (TPR) repeat protein
MPANSERVKLVFLAALEVPLDRRASYIASACTDPQDRMEVEDLLRHHAVPDRFLESFRIRAAPNVFSPDELVAKRFCIKRLIGAGAMGEVYEAFDKGLGVSVALKTLRPELTSDPDASNRFRREILVARKASHENLCKIYDLVSESDGAIVPCLSMELIEGESLQTYLQTHRPLSPEQALPIVKQIAGAIDALHSHGIVHRDLKPSNIMLTTRAGILRAVVTDFGLAKPATQTETGFFESNLEFQPGAPYFMAPELFDNEPPTHKSDIYALGLIIDEMVTETRAFPGESLYSLYRLKLFGDPESPLKRSKQLPAPWETIILKCLEKTPENRYSRVLDVVADLELPERVALAPVPKVPVLNPVPSQPAGKRQGWRFSALGRRAWIALAAGALILAGAMAMAGSLTNRLTGSVVVFPIENLSRQPDLNYLCEGIRAELMRRLTLIDGIRVIPYYEPRSKTQIGQLKGRFSLEGLLQATGNRVRLTAQLTENSDGTLLWSQNFERDIQDPLLLQSDIAEGSVQALQVGTLLGRTVSPIGARIPVPSRLLKLLGFQRVAVPRAATTSSAAFDYYLRGQYLFEERTVPAALDAIRSYENALREDPSFALARAAMADAQFVLMDYEYAPNTVLVARAKAYAEDAVRLDPNLAEGYTSLGAVRQEERDFAGAEQSYRTAIQLNPRFSRGHRWYAGLIIQFGRYEESLEEMRSAVEIDPYDYSARINQATFLFYARRYREAAAELEETLTHKDLIAAHIALGDVYSELGAQSSGAEAQAYFTWAIQQADLVEKAVRRSMAQSPPQSGALTIKYADRMHAEYYMMSGRNDPAQPYLDHLVADTAAGRISPGALGRLYAVLGDAARAMPLLESAAARKDHALFFLKVAPQFDRLRGDTRFQALLEHLGLE